MRPEISFMMTQWENESHVFASSLRKSKVRELDEITCDLDMTIVQSEVTTSRALISKIHCTLSANQKRVREFNV